MKKAIKIVAIMVAVVTLAFTSTAFADIPQKSSSFYVADYADVISQDTEDYIVSKNGQLENLCGGQIVVVAVDFLDGMDIEDYCYKVFNEWEIGSAEENNGVLLLLAIGEEDYWCMQGKGLESRLSSGDISEMLWDYLESDFAAGNYDSGVRSFFDRIYDEVSHIYSGQSDVSSSQGNGWKIARIVIGVAIILVLLAVLLSVKGGSSRRRRTSAGYPPPPPRPPRRRRYNSRPAPPPRPRENRPPSPRPASRPAPRPTSRTSSRSSFGGTGRGGGGRSRGGGAGRSK